jgi:hypothetical protein
MADADAADAAAAAGAGPAADWRAELEACKRERDRLQKLVVGARIACLLQLQGAPARPRGPAAPPP